jgi:hypothetical protein
LDHIFISNQDFHIFTAFIPGSFSACPYSAEEKGHAVLQLVEALRFKPEDS